MEEKEESSADSVHPQSPTPPPQAKGQGGEGGEETERDRDRQTEERQTDRDEDRDSDKDRETITAYHICPRGAYRKQTPTNYIMAKNIIFKDIRKM